MDHGETEHEALARELREEVAYEGNFTFRPIGLEPRYLPWRHAYLLWIVYEIDCETPPPATRGVDVLAVAYRDTAKFRDSINMAEQLVYKWTVDRSHVVTAAE